MTRLYTLHKVSATAMALCVAVAGVAAQAPKGGMGLRQARTVLKTEMKASVARLGQSRQAKRAAARQAVMRPVTQELYFADGMGGWELDATYVTDWNSFGKAVKDVITMNGLESDNVQVITYTYDDKGNMTERITRQGDSEAAAADVSRRVRAYDEKMPWVVTLNMDYIPASGGGWELSHYANNFKTEVARDNAGNVLSVMRANLYGDQWLPMTKFEVSYGADGKPQKLVELSYDSTLDQWDVVDDYNDCQWDAFTGQVSSIEDCFEDGNRLSAYTTVDDDGETVAVQILYPDENHYVQCSELAGMPVFLETTLMPNGSYRQTIVAELEIMPGLSLFMGEGYAEITDELDNLILSAEYSFDKEDGLTEIYTWVEGINTPDAAAAGMPASYHQREFIADEGDSDDDDDEYLFAASRSVAKKITLADLPDFSPYAYTEIPDHIAGEWNDLLRIDFSDYKDYAGIGTVAADSADAPAEYFTVDGRRVATPAHGLYIVRRGSAVSKIMVR